MKTVEINSDSGFCFGVVNTIRNAEKELITNHELFCLGDIVHNSQEVDRLQKKGLITINHEELRLIHDKKVLFRAHGEPPSTYEIAAQNRIQIVDATCPVVLQLQKKIRKIYLSVDYVNSQIVIFGKKGHAEVNGLVGQTEDFAIVIEKKEDIEQLNFNKNIYLFSQTTMSINNFKTIVDTIQNHMSGNTTFDSFDTICRQVANRISNIRRFAEKHDLILFVASKKSSNGKVLLNECKQANQNTYLISSTEDIRSEWLRSDYSTGICGATSTPKWLMEKVANHVLLAMPSC